MIRPCFFQSLGAVGEKTPGDRGTGHQQDTASATPPTTVRPGRAGSTSRPPGAPETNAVTSRRRLNE